MAVPGPLIDALAAPAAPLLTEPPPFKATTARVPVDYSVPKFATVPAVPAIETELLVVPTISPAVKPL
jgi:hypothetical protein